MPIVATPPWGASKGSSRAARSRSQAHARPTTFFTVLTREVISAAADGMLIGFGHESARPKSLNNGRLHKDISLARRKRTRPPGPGGVSAH